MTNSVAGTGGQAGTRIAAIDGLRGVAIVLVVLTHIGTVWPTAQRIPLGPLEWAFDAAGPAVTIFYVIAGFFAAKALLRGYATGGIAGTASAFTRRWLRLAVQLWVLLLVVLVAAHVDSADPYSTTGTRDSLLSSATHTFNTYVAHNALVARADIGALYFLDIDIKFFVVATLLVCLLGRYRKVLVAATGIAIPLCWAWRWHYIGGHDWFSASLSSPVRMDGLLVGALGAMLAPRIRPMGHRGAELLGGLLLVLGGLLVSCAFVDVVAYYTWQGPLVDLAVVGMLLVVAQPGADLGGSVAGRFLGHGILTRVGSRSLTVFLWHLPIFFAVARHTASWNPLWRTLLALLLTTVVVVIVERVVAQPVTRWVASIGRQGVRSVRRGSARRGGAHAPP